MGAFIFLTIDDNQITSFYSMPHDPCHYDKSKENFVFENEVEPYLLKKEYGKAIYTAIDIIQKGAERKSLNALSDLVENYFADRNKGSTCTDEVTWPTSTNELPWPLFIKVSASLAFISILTFLEAYSITWEMPLAFEAARMQNYLELFLLFALCAFAVCMVCLGFYIICKVEPNLPPQRARKAKPDPPPQNGGKKALEQAETLQRRFKTKECPICHEAFKLFNEDKVFHHKMNGCDGRRVVLLQCGHVYDRSCWDLWTGTERGRNRNCPTCQEHGVEVNGEESIH